MGEIYSKAALVVGHLHTEHLFRVGLLIRRMVQALANGKQFDMSHGATYPIFRALTEIFCNPYFQRAWVVQEIVLAKSIILVYRSDCIHLDHLMEIVRGQSSGKIVPGGSFIMGRIDRTQVWMDEWKSFLAGISPFGDQMTVTDRLRPFMRLEALKRPTIAEAVDQNVSLGVKNPRDRIYALLSLASDPTTPRTAAELQHGRSKQRYIHQGILALSARWSTSELVPGRRTRRSGKPFHQGHR